MTQQLQNATTRKTLRIMLGHMYPSEMSDMTEDRQIRHTNIPEWIEKILQEECQLVVARLPRYEARIEEKYGPIESLIGKLMVYHTVRDDWDSLEPCNFENMRPLRFYFDEHIDPTVKRRILRANTQAVIRRRDSE